LCVFCRLLILIFLQLLPKETVPTARKADEPVTIAVQSISSLAALQSAVGQLLQQAEAAATAARAGSMESQ